jgi:hypothetical protein
MRPETLARDLGATRKNVQIALGKLVEAGELRVEQCGRGLGGRTYNNRYWMIETEVVDEGNSVADDALNPKCSNPKCSNPKCSNPGNSVVGDAVNDVNRVVGDPKPRRGRPETASWATPYSRRGYSRRDIPYKERDLSAASPPRASCAARGSAAEEGVQASNRAERSASSTGQAASASSKGAEQSSVEQSSVEQSSVERSSAERAASASSMGAERSRGRLTTFPADWVLGPAELEDAREICPHWSEEEVTKQFGRMQDWYSAKNARSADWLASWRNWCNRGKDNDDAKRSKSTQPKPVKAREPLKR